MSRSISKILEEIYGQSLEKPITHSGSFKKSRFQSLTNGLKSGDDVISYFAKHGNETLLKFVFCVKSSDSDPYSLTVLHPDPFQRLPCDYYVITPTGIMHTTGEGFCYHHKLSEWVSASADDKIIKSIPFFNSFSKWRELRYLLTLVREGKNDERKN